MNCTVRITEKYSHEELPERYANFAKRHNCARTQCQYFLRIELVKTSQNPKKPHGGFKGFL